MMGGCNLGTTQQQIGNGRNTEGWARWEGELAFSDCENSLQASRATQKRKRMEDQFAHESSRKKAHIENELTALEIAMKEQRVTMEAELDAKRKAIEEQRVAMEVE